MKPKERGVVDVGWIYGPVNDVEDIARINCIIRDEMLIAQDVSQLTELKKRSDYLCTLTHSPFWKNKFGDKIEEVRKEAIKQNRASVRLANMIAKVKGWDKKYSPWGKDKYPDFEKHLSNVVNELLEEIEHAVYEDREQIEIDIRRLFCQIRFSMLYVEAEGELVSLQKKAEIWAFTTFGKFFMLFFDEDILERMREIVIGEYNKTAQLANVVAEYHDWDIEFERFNETNIEQEEEIEEYINRLEEEEKRASSYVPSEAKYGNDGKVLWIVYDILDGNKGSRKRAKRVYLPADAEIIAIEGPSWYTTRFGRKVWGVKIYYTKTIGPRVIKRGDLSIKLGPTKVKRSKIIELPQGVTKYEIRKQRPIESIRVY